MAKDKRLKKAYGEVDRSKAYALSEAIKLVKQTPRRNSTRRWKCR